MTNKLFPIIAMMSELPEFKHYLVSKYKFYSVFECCDQHQLEISSLKIISTFSVKFAS